MSSPLPCVLQARRGSSVVLARHGRWHPSPNDRPPPCAPHADHSIAHSPLYVAALLQKLLQASRSSLLYSTHSPRRGQQPLLSAAAVPLPSLLSLALWRVGSTHSRTRHSFCLPPSLSGSPSPLETLLVALRTASRVTRFLFAVSGNRAAATATGRATETPESRTQTNQPATLVHIATRRPPRRVASRSVVRAAMYI